MKLSFRLPRRKNSNSNTKENKKKNHKKGPVQVPCVSEKRELVWLRWPLMEEDSASRETTTAGQGELLLANRGYFRNEQI